MTYKFLAHKSDGRVLYRADWVDGRQNKTNFVCVSPEFYETRMAAKGVEAYA